MEPIGISYLAVGTVANAIYAFESVWYMVISKLRVAPIGLNEGG